MDDFSVFGNEPSSSAFAPETTPPRRSGNSDALADNTDVTQTYVTSIDQVALLSPKDTHRAPSGNAGVKSPSGPRRPTRHLQVPVDGVAEEPSGQATPTAPPDMGDDPRPVPVPVSHNTDLAASTGSSHSSSRDGSQGSTTFGRPFSPNTPFGQPPPAQVHSSPLTLHLAPRVKGAVEPQPLPAARKGQLVAAPTGGSDSDTASAGSLHSRGSRAAPSVEESDTDDEAEEQRFVDEFGFVIDEDQKEADEKFIRKIDGKQVKRREIKWANMTSDWSRTNTKMHSKLKERCRKGIPSRMRGVAWQLLCESRTLMNASDNVGVYIALREKRLADKEIDAIISRDLARTFPKHILFKDQGGVGQTFLRNVLHAYAGIDPEVGYVQGMAFLVGALSTQMGEEESFWALHEMMYNERYKMRELFRPGFPLLHQFFYQFKRLLARLLPKLSRHFETLGVDPSFYASQWFLTLFVYHFPFRALLRVWDIFFSEGWKIIFRIGLTLLQWEEKKLLAMPFEDVLASLKTLQDGKDSKELIRRAHRIKFKTAELNRYGEEYWQSVGGKSD